MSKIMHIILDMASLRTPVSFADAMVDWLRTKALSQASVSAYRGEVNRLALYCAQQGVGNLERMKARHWHDYIGCLERGRPEGLSARKASLKSSSVRQAYRIGRSFLAYCTRRGWITWSPLDAAALPSEGPAAQAGSVVSAMSDVVDAPSAALSPALRRVLRGEGHASDEATARQYFLLVLSFWGVLSPSEIAVLGVRHLRRCAEGAELDRPGSGSPVALPPQALCSWLDYREFRETRSGARLDPASPLISSLRCEGPVTAWTVWSDLRVALGTSQASTRTFRRAYLEMATAPAARAMAAVRRQAGLRAPRAGAFTRGALSSALRDANGVALESLRRQR